MLWSAISRLFPGTRAQHAGANDCCGEGSLANNMGMTGIKVVSLFDESHGLAYLKNQIHAQGNSKIDLLTMY